MGIDDYIKKQQQRATEEAGKAAVRGIFSAARKAISGIADELLGFAEGELEGARAARGDREALRPGEMSAEDPEPAQDDGDPEPVPPSAVELEAERTQAAEEAAQDELARLKARLGRGEGLGLEAPAPRPEVESPRSRARREAEERARAELEALKAGRGGADSEDRADPEVKRTL